MEDHVAALEDALVALRLRGEEALELEGALSVGEDRDGLLSHERGGLAAVVLVGHKLHGVLLVVGGAGGVLLEAARVVALDAEEGVLLREAGEGGVDGGVLVEDDGARLVDLLPANVATSGLPAVHGFSLYVKWGWVGLYLRCVCVLTVFSSCTRFVGLRV